MANEKKLVRDMEFEEFVEAFPEGPYSSFSDEAKKYIYDELADNGVEFDLSRICETYVEYWSTSDVVSAYDFILDYEPLDEDAAIEDLMSRGVIAEHLLNDMWLCYRL